MTDHSELIHQPHLGSCSVESLLSVPLRFIFRETHTGDRGGSNHTSFLFSKSEVSTLLRVSMVSAFHHVEVVFITMNVLMSIIFVLCYMDDS